MIKNLPSADTMRNLRLDSALAKQKKTPYTDARNVHCEVCGSFIARYQGPGGAVICNTCYCCNNNRRFRHGGSVVATPIFNP